MSEDTGEDIKLKNSYAGYDLYAYEIDGGVSISVFEFECVLTKADTVKLRDFLHRCVD